MGFGFNDLASEAGYNPGGTDTDDSNDSDSTDGFNREAYLDPTTDSGSFGGANEDQSVPDDIELSQAEELAIQSEQFDRGEQKNEYVVENTDTSGSEGDIREDVVNDALDAGGIEDDFDESDSEVAATISENQSSGSNSPGPDPTPDSSGSSNSPGPDPTATSSGSLDLSTMQKAAVAGAGALALLISR